MGGNGIRIGILTISDLGAVGQRADTSGDAILDWAAGRGYDVVVRSVVPDEPDRIAITPEAAVKLSGLVTGTPGGVQTNRPVTGASVEIYRVSPDTGERIGGAIHTSQTGSDGRWASAT